MCWKRCCTALTSVAVRRKTWLPGARSRSAEAAKLTIIPRSCDADRGSLLRLGGARQELQQVSAARNAHQAEYPAPKAPRFGVEFHQRQAFVQMPQRFVNDGAGCRHGCGAAAAGEGEQRSFCIPFNAKIRNRRAAEGARGAAVRAAQKHIEFMRSSPAQAPRTVAAI